MTISVLCESPRDRHPQEKCASKCIRSSVLSAFIYFLAQRISDLKFTNRVLINLRSEIPFRTFASKVDFSHKEAHKAQGLFRDVG